MAEHDYDNLLMQLRLCHTPGSCHHCTIDAAKCHRKISKLSLEVQAAVAFEALRSENMQLKTQIPQWVSVDERLPEQGKRYLVLGYFHATNKPFIEILWHDAHDLWWNRLYKGDYSVTHWMPLPEPPKGVE